LATEVHDVPERFLYEIDEDGTAVGAATYRISDGLIEFLHTRIDADRSGRGLAGTLIRFALDDARRRGLGVLPHCPYVRSFIDTHADEYLDLVPPERRGQYGLEH
jgi:predicted GNAT family acetyltransferase